MLVPSKIDLIDANLVEKVEEQEDIMEINEYVRENGIISKAINIYP